jgi:hypothetical protein
LDQDAANVRAPERVGKQDHGNVNKSLEAVEADFPYRDRKKLCNAILLEFGGFMEQRGHASTCLRRGRPD